MLNWRIVALITLLISTKLLVNWQAYAFAPQAVTERENDSERYRNIQYWEDKTGLTRNEILKLQSSYLEWIHLIVNKNLSPQEHNRINSLFNAWQPLMQKGSLDIDDLEKLIRQHFRDTDPS